MPMIFHSWILLNGINQSDAVLFSVGDHDLPRISVLCRFQCFCHSSYSTLSHFVSPSNIFSRCFPLLRFPSIIPVVTRSSNFPLHFLVSHNITPFPKKKKRGGGGGGEAWRLRILIMSDFFLCVCRLLLTLFCLISLQSMRFVAFSEETTFLLPPVSFVFWNCTGLASIHLNELHITLQGSSSCVNRDVVLISFSGNFFSACATLYAIPLFLRPSLDTKVP